MTTATPPAMRTLTTAKGRTVETHLTDAEALDLCSRLPSAFAQDLVRKQNRYGLSREQMIWVHILVMESFQPEPARVQLNDLPGLVALFTAAGEKLQRPRIRMSVGGKTLVISLNRARGVLYVTDGADRESRTYFGKVQMDGAFLPVRDCPDWVQSRLLHLSQDPAKCAAAYGKLTGRCCFCDLPLTDDRSTAEGYGPVCAKHFGLPWGRAQVSEAPASYTYAYVCTTCDGSGQVPFGAAGNMEIMHTCPDCGPERGRYGYE